MRWIPLFVGTLILAGCSGPIERVAPEDRIEIADGFATAGLVDVAVVPVMAARGPIVTDQLLSMIRDEARSFLIQRKLYAVPTNAFVDQKSEGGNDLAPGTLGTDAVLHLEFEEFDPADFTSGGSFSVSGIARLEGPSGPLFTREFRNLRYLAPAASAPATTLESLASMAGIVARELLAPLPPKPIQ